MARVLGPLLLVVAVVGGYLWYRNQGTSRTVTTPGAPNADAARRAGDAAVHGADNLVQTHAAQIGYVLAFLLLGGLLWAIWTKLGKGWLILLAVVALVATGVLTLGHR